MAKILNQALIGLGANIGDRWSTLRQALEALRSTPGIGTVEPSPVFETEPVGGVEQPRFLNMVAGLETHLTPEELMAKLHAVERSFGRNRATEKRWGPRTLDLDLLAYENEVRSGPDLILPHPRMAGRPFVLIPLRALLKRSTRFTEGRWGVLSRMLQAQASAPGVVLWSDDSGYSETRG